MSLQIARALSMMVCMAAGLCAQPVFTTIYEFKGAPTDGAAPIGGVVIGPDGVLYGSTLNGQEGGNAGSGVVYSLTPPTTPGGTWTEKVLWSFLGGPADGASPWANVTLGPGGVIYGTTEAGGTRGYGVVFSLSPSASGPWTETIVHNFTGGDDGASPFSPVTVSANGTIYGATLSGGLQRGGTVYALTPPVELPPALIDSFGGVNGGNCCPTAPVLIGKHGVLYSTTSYGGTATGGVAGGGTVFSLTPAPNGAWMQHILYTFPPTTTPGTGQSAVIGFGPHGTLVGTTVVGGANNDGSVFILTPPATTGQNWTLQTIYTFSGPDGANPTTGVVVGSSGVLYGTTRGGGANGWGTVFSLTPPPAGGAAWTEQVLHSFTDGADGGRPNSLAIDSRGVLYGTAYFGGISATNCVTTCGVVFSLKP